MSTLDKDVLNLAITIISGISGIQTVKKGPPYINPELKMPVVFVWPGRDRDHRLTGFPPNDEEIEGDIEIEVVSHALDMDGVIDLSHAIRNTLLTDANISAFEALGATIRGMPRTGEPNVSDNRETFWGHTGFTLHFDSGVES